MSTEVTKIMTTRRETFRHPTVLAIGTDPQSHNEPLVSTGNGAQVSSLNFCHSTYSQDPGQVTS